MRELPWERELDAVLSWFTAYGYFGDATNRQVLRSVRRVLRDAGRFLVELNHRDWAACPERTARFAPTFAGAPRRPPRWSLLTEGADVSEITLVVQSDDFGMCHAVNEGVVRGFTEGILTQASVMVPCPWFDEAAELALSHRIPVGVHCTLTAEWDHMRYRPLTAGANLRGVDGTFHRTILAARESVTVEDAVEELIAQTERFVTAGLEPSYFDCHMGTVRREAYERVCERYGKPFMYEVGRRVVPFATREGLSAREAEDKLPFLIDYLESLAPGVHLLVTHCGVASDELASLARPDTANFVWTQPYRESDLACVTEPKVREVVQRRGIRLASVAELV